MKKGSNIDRIVMYLLLFVVMAVPLIKPMGIPLEISPETQAAYDFIESIPEGSTVWIDFAYRPATAPESLSQSYAVCHQLFKKNFKVIFFYCIPEASPYVVEVTEKLSKEYNKEYGVDYVNLGYKPNLDSALNGMARNFAEIFPTDVDGTPTSSLPITKNIKGVDDIAMFFVVHTGSPGVDSYFQQIEGQFKKPIVASMTAINGPTLYPRFEAGQLKGMIVGLRGSAEYELLVKEPGSAISGMDAQSLGHLLIAASIVIGTIQFLVKKSKGGEADA
ncbi:MAG: hypothetical protein ACOX5M_00610 [Bacillota bacterium]